MSKLILHLFGSPRIEVNGAPAELDTRKATALMAYLAVSGDTHQRDSLAALLWPDYDQTSARAALRRTLSTLNRALEGGDSRDAESPSGILEITRETIGVSPRADFWLDVREFHRLLASLGTHPHSTQEVCPACLKTLEEATRLYHEPFLAGFNLRDSPNFEEWQFFQEETLRRELALALEKLVRGLEASGAVEEAIQHARRWLALDPLLEEAHRQLMLLYTRADQRNAALRQYRECVRILDQELGVAPLEETTRLYQAILNRGTPLPENESRLRFVEEAPAKTAAQHEPAAAAHPTPAPPLPEAPEAPARPLVGRDAALEQIQRAYTAAQGSGRLVALEGEAGIGKTRLSDAFLSWARARGARIIQARCYSGETGLAYAPLIEGLSSALALPEADARLRALPAGTLAEASRLVPGFSQPAGKEGNAAGGALTAGADDGAQARFFEALRQAIHALLSGPVPGVLFLDDLHWADSATLDLLAYHARRLSGMGILILAAWRSEPGETAQALERLAGELARSGRADRIHLKRLEPAEIEALVKSFPGTSGADPAALSRRLYQESEGLPFVAVEYLTALAAQKFPQTWEIPASVRDLLRSRMAGLDSTAQQLLSTAAVIGRSFDFSTLHEASGRSEFETIDGLDQLLSAGLIVEAGAGAAGAGAAGAGTAGNEIQYDFTHEKLRALIYEETSLARRRLLHRRTAESLGRASSSRAEYAGLVAYHYEQGGMDAAAADYHRIAGERARQLFANVEAMAHFESALAAGHADAAGLHEAIGDLHTLRGEYGAAIASYQAAASLCTPGCLANLEHKLGNVHQRMGEWELAESHYQACLENSGEPEGAPSPFHVHLFADRSMVAYALGDLEKAQALADRALVLAQSTASARDLAQAFNAQGVLARARGDQTAAIQALEASLRAAETLDDPLARIAALNNLALVYGEANSLEEAILLASQALELCQRRGDRHREAALHNNLADLLHRCRREEEAMQQLKQAVVIFAEIGAPDQDSASPARAAEIWKLTEW